MRSSVKQWLYVTAFLVLLPGAVPAQTVASSLDELQKFMKPDQVLLITDRSGRETWGKVAELTGSSLTLAVVYKRPTWTGLIRPNASLRPPAAAGGRAAGVHR
jgi:hypothetical protein